MRWMAIHHSRRDLINDRDLVGRSNFSLPPGQRSWVGLLGHVMSDVTRSLVSAHQDLCPPPCSPTRGSTPFNRSQPAGLTLMGGRGVLASEHETHPTFSICTLTDLGATPKRDRWPQELGPLDGAFTGKELIWVWGPAPSWTSQTLLVDLPAGPALGFVADSIRLKTS